MSKLLRLSIPQSGRRSTLPLIVLLSTFLIASCTSPLVDSGGGRAAIVVKHSDGSTSSACVTFDGDEIDGEELLNLSGIPYVADFGNSMGSILCSIEGDGCNFPSEKCFCDCSKPGSCAYWGYFVKDEEGGWVYAPIGARLRKVVDGDLDAWVWVETGGFGQVKDSSLVPDVVFEEICEG